MFPLRGRSRRVVGAVWVGAGAGDWVVTVFAVMGGWLQDEVREERFVSSMRRP